jgi:hypothetical protein
MELTDEEKEALILARMKERAIESLLFLSCPDCGHMAAYLGREGRLGHGECLLCGRRVLFTADGKHIWQKGENYGVREG